MRPTEILQAEHRVILRVVAVLEALLDRSALEGRIAADSGAAVLDFLRTFADAWHHDREENCLFPRLVELGLPSRHGPVAAMLDEHDVGRASVRGMQETLADAAQGDADALETFVEHGRDLVKLQRDHVAKEDQVLFPMAAGCLLPATEAEILSDFAQAERAHPPGTHERMLELARALGECYGIAEPEDTSILRPASALSTPPERAGL